ncbi:ATP-dependent helicase [Ideonella lacteola]|uniref:ATP-dependent helicase n=1 Tax=Ideonella lacteola TaxID=2984193 RepID=UPI003BF9F4AA
MTTPATHAAAASVAARVDPLASLNEPQREAAEHGDGPLLVIAGAGAGKTMTLAARVARLVLGGADPNRLMLLTFSRRAAVEMQQRVAGLLQASLGLPAGAAPVLPWAGTFHAIGARLLREQAGRLGLSDDFTILDRADAEDLMGWVREAQGLARAAETGSARFPLKGTCLAIYSRAVNSQAQLSDVLRQAFPWCAHAEEGLRGLFRAYEATKRDQHALDYDDLLLWWAELMREPDVAAWLGERFTHVLVDEYQDTNRLQAAILLALKPQGRGLTVVGDDAQAIYSFRAAEVRNILDFPGAFSPPARVVTLDRNYRSTTPLLTAANAVIALAPERFKKALWTDRAGTARPQLVAVDDETAQARWVVDHILARREGGLKLKSQAVLFRTSSHSAALELELARRQIPYVKYGGLKFLEAAHVKDVLSILRWASNPRLRLAGFRVAQLVPGIGPATARRLLDAMDAHADPAAVLQAFEPPAAVRGEWEGLAALMQRLSAHSEWPGDMALVADWYGPHLERLHDHPVPRRADIEQLARLAAGHASRERFLTELTLDPPQATSDEAGDPHLDEDYLILSTIHAAKGQEWSAVSVLNVIDGCIPGDLSTATPAQLEEERRLLYVAMTRARHHLSLMVPQRFYVTQQRRFGDRHLYGGLSRFITPEVAEHFDSIGPATPNWAIGPPTPPPGAVLDLARRLRERW